MPFSRTDSKKGDRRQNRRRSPCFLAGIRRRSSLRIRCRRRSALRSSLVILYDDLPAFVIAAVLAYAMRQLWLMALRAGRQCRSCRFPVRPARSLALLGCSSFWYRHLYLLPLSYSKSLSLANGLVSSTTVSGSSCSHSQEPSFRSAPHVGHSPAQSSRHNTCIGTIVTSRSRTS